MLTDLLNLSISFIRENYVKILLALGLSFLFYLIFYVTTFSLKKLKLEAFSSYPFDTFFPQGGSWSVGYFLIVILLFGVLIFLLLNGNFYSSPA
ncbi:MAG TPA: hypothetical protein VKC54_04850 [Patescibacteria group bacterium]|nr:hypothetical protein [Patescibacteria group bacterium]